ncbi:hypothetical protein GCM10009821_04670 [Aeromicrobium halocynthiae]|uniref:Antigen 84 n=1 Tax=Aeromicrobium halocynthiae TaxID=560557 RepID=A0ABP5HHI4_9ACTN
MDTADDAAPRRLRADDVRAVRFSPVRLREGYDMREVDLFLDDVEAELRRHEAARAACPHCES